MESCGGGVAQEVVLIKVRCFINTSRKWKKFLRKFNRITKLSYIETCRIKFTSFNLFKANLYILSPSQKMAKIAKNVQKWPKMAINSQKWPKMPNWLKITEKWPKYQPLRYIWKPKPSTSNHFWNLTIPTTNHVLKILFMVKMLNNCLKIKVVQNASIIKATSF